MRTGDTPLVVRLDGDAQDPGLGGKATWLDRLIGAGFAVPTTAVLTTQVYEAVVGAPDLAALVAELQVSDADPDDAAAEQERVDRAFLSAPLPAVVQAALDEAFAVVVPHGQGRVAVRSSATAEDMAATSFAGQYSSFLGVDRQGFERAVRLVWASLWHPAPRAYRRFHAIDQRRIAMAVIVMAMLDAEQAGVAFSEDPGGSADHVRVEVVTGLGEQLVSGAVTPGVHLVPRSGPAPDDVPAVARTVAGLAVAVEDAFGQPQDVEWASVGTDVLLLQARPITTTAAPVDGDGFDTTTGPDTRWTTAGVAEALPGALAPLIWQLNRRAFEGALRERFANTGTLPRDVEERGGFIGRLRGRAVMNLGLIEAASGSTSAAAAADVEQQYFGSGTGGALGAVTRGKHTSLRQRARRWRVLLLGAHADRLASVEAETVIVAADALVPLMNDLGDLADRDRTALLSLRANLVDLAERAVSAEVGVAAAAAAAYRRLELTLQRRFDPPEAARWAQLVTTGTASITPSRPPDPDSSRAILGGPTWHETGQVPAPVTRPAPPDSADADVSGEDPGGPGVGQHPATRAWDELVRRLRELPSWDMTRVLTGQVVDVRLIILRRHIEDATELLQRREHTKRALLGIGGQIRRVHLAIGSGLVGAGTLEAAADVDFLSEREMVGAVPPPSLAQIARRRRWLEQQAEAGALPQRFQGPPPEPRVPVASGSALRGWAAAPGSHTGRAVVLTAPLPARLDRGDVVVAHNTDASWAPVFMRAGAVIVEEGGPLSHAAIVARELGIPAVLNIPGITARLAGDGTIVTVDGDAGRVIVHPTPEPTP